MKSFHLAIFLFLTLSIPVLSGCKKEKTPATHVNTFSAKVNGTPLIVKGIIARTFDNTINGKLTLHVDGRNEASEVVQLSYREFTFDPVSLVIDSVAQSPASGYYYNQRHYWFQSDMIQARSGNLNLTSVDKTTYPNGSVVTGNFNFETTRGINSPNPNFITEGKFSVFIEN
jgi:hypothetical protein